MRLTSFITLAMVIAGSQVFAGGYGSAGCGLGSAIFGPGHGFSQVFAATTNGTFGSQTFGITSGTSNCGGSGYASLPAFAEANRVALANDIARGNGETLAGLSEKLNCATDAQRMGAVLQKNYRSIFPSSSVGGDQISQSILNILRKDSELSKSCSV